MSSSRSSASKITARSGTWTSLQSGLHSDQWKAVYMGCFAQRRFVLRNNPWNNPFKPSCLLGSDIQTLTMMKTLAPPHATQGASNLGLWTVTQVPCACFSSIPGRIPLISGLRLKPGGDPDFSRKCAEKNPCKYFTAELEGGFHPTCRVASGVLAER